MAGGSRSVRERDLLERDSTGRVTHRHARPRRGRGSIVQLLLVRRRQKARHRLRRHRLVRVRGVRHITQPHVRLRQRDVAGLAVHRLDVGGRDQLHPVLEHARRLLGQHERLPDVGTDRHVADHSRQVEHRRLRGHRGRRVADVRQGRLRHLPDQVRIVEVRPRGGEVRVADLLQRLPRLTAGGDADSVRPADVATLVPVTRHISPQSIRECLRSPGSPTTHSCGERR